jgi:hypothetical protein
MESEVEAKKKNGLKQIVKRELCGNMTLRETSAVQEPVVVLCITRRHDSQKPNHDTKLECSSVNSKSHNQDTVFSEKIPCVRQKIYRRHRRTPRRHFQGAVYILLAIWKQTVPPSYWQISITIYDVTCRKQFFFQCNVKVFNDKRDIAQGDCKNGKKLRWNIFTGIR